MHAGTWMTNDDDDDDVFMENFKKEDSNASVLSIIVLTD